MANRYVRPPVELLWCPDSRSNRGNGWSFPPVVEAKIKEIVGCRSCLHLFGGRSAFGTRLDVDAITRPDVIGDAWLPPFSPGSFQVVVLDPPYFQLNGRLRSQLQLQAAYIASETIVWLHTQWISGGNRWQMQRGWLVRAGRSAFCRCLIEFRRLPGTVTLPAWVTAGPAIKYRRWIVQPQSLPFAQPPRE